MKMKKLKKLMAFFLWMVPIGIWAQGEVSGTVTDQTDGSLLPGVNILVKGTTTGTQTDFDGKYSLNVNSFPATLVFSYLGYETKEVQVTSATTVNVAMTQAATGLDEVVVTGLATSVKRSNAANAVGSVSSEELTGRTPPQTLDGALAGKFTGAVISSSSGAPGGGISVKLRGVTSVNGNSQPLYIIDGVYVNNNSIAAAGLNAVSGAASGGSASNQDNPSNRIADINPDDIANIEILKGASAAAIYGSRAAAGVIIITTKKGKQGKTKVSLSQAIGYNEAINLQGQRNWTAELAESAFGEGALFTAAQNNGTLRDYEKEIFGEKGFITNTSVNISGGNEKTSFFAGFTNNEEDGIVKRTGYTKKSVRLNVDHRITDYMKLSLTSNYISSSADRGFFNNDNSGTTLGVALTSTRPWDYLLPDANGNYPDHPNNSSNPIQTRDLMTNNEKVSRLIAGGTLDVNLFRNDNSNLKLVLRAGFDTYTLKTNVFFPRELQFMRPDVGGVDGVTADGTTENKDANYSAFLVHNLTTNNNISFTTQAGLTNEQFSRNTIRVTTSGLIASEQNVDQGANTAVQQFRLEQEDAGFFVQEEVNYQDKIIGTLGLRGDKSSNNGDANELFYYPKASAAVNLHNFDFWNMGALNRFKLRAAYGEAGNFAPNGALFTTYTNSLIDGNVGIIVPLTLGDPNIKPERQKEFELGFDAGLLDNKVSLEFTWYNKKVEDLILRANNQPSSGFGTRWANAGALQNKGVEIGLNVKAFDTEDFGWDSGVMFFKNKSEVTELTVDAFDTGGFGTGLGTFRVEEGKSVTQIVGNDENGNVVVLGDAEPDFQMSFTNNLRYKDFTLSFLWHWKKGGDNVNLTKLLSDFGGTSADYDDTNLDPSGTLNNGDYRISGFLGGFATPFVEDASYLRLREVGLYYNIPTSTLNNWFDGVVSDVKVGLSGNNLINIFDYNSYDPEVSNFGQNGLSTGVEVTPFPSSKRLLFHVSVGF
jgi:TonB-linked SusC/RagA family outer membrane protein